MKTKNYNQAFEELIKCLLKNTKEAKCVTALKFLVEEYKGDVNLKEIVVTEYAKFLGFWFPYLRETLKTSKKMQNYPILDTCMCGNSRSNNIFNYFHL